MCKVNSGTLIDLLIYLMKIIVYSLFEIDFQTYFTVNPIGVHMGSGAQGGQPAS